MLLTLFRRKGCCLCEALEQKLRKIPLNDLRPLLKLEVVDIDDVDVPENVRARYDLEIPVMAFWSEQLGRNVELPRVSPRLNEEELFCWLKKSIDMVL